MAATLASLYRVDGRVDSYHPRTAFVSITPSAIQPYVLKPLKLTNCESINQYISPLNKNNYVKLNPDHVERTALQDTHALFGTLYGDGFIEKYDVYRRLHPTIVSSNKNRVENPKEVSNKEIIAVNLTVGHKLNGHDKIVHGGIISLLIDEAMGWAAYESLEHHNLQIDEQYKPHNTLLVTANLNIDFRAPFLAGSNALLRVSLDEENTAGRKMYFVARLESYDGVVFAEAKSLFLCVAAEKMKDVMETDG